MKKGIAVGIIALFIITAVSPMVIGNCAGIKNERRVTVLEDPPSIVWSKTYGGVERN